MVFMDVLFARLGRTPDSEVVEKILAAGGGTAFTEVTVAGLIGKSKSESTMKRFFQ